MENVKWQMYRVRPSPLTICHFPFYICHQNDRPRPPDRRHAAARSASAAFRGPMCWPPPAIDRPAATHASSARSPGTAWPSFSRSLPAADSPATRRGTSFPPTTSGCACRRRGRCRSPGAFRFASATPKIFANGSVTLVITFTLRRRANIWPSGPAGCCLPLAKANGLSELWITCNPDNLASRRTCERLGAELVDIVPVPFDHPLWSRGDVAKCRYHLSL